MVVAVAVVDRNDDLSFHVLLMLDYLIVRERGLEMNKSWRVFKIGVDEFNWEYIFIETGTYIYSFFFFMNWDMP